MKSVLLLTVVLTAALTATAAEPVSGTHIVVLKAQRRLELYAGTTLLQSYRIGLGTDPVTAKRRQGDRTTPEGEYRVCGKNPASTYFKALVLDYPNGADAERGLRQRLINRGEQAQIVAAAQRGACPPFGTRLGGEVEIHGMGSGSDWTWGCIALDNAAIADLYARAAVGTPVTIKP